VTRVLFVKHGDAKNFVVVDAAMNDIIRPTLYDAYHEIWPVDEPAPAAKRIRADVVGPVCESGDFLARTGTWPSRKARASGRHDCRRLRRGAGRHLQHPRLGAEVLVNGANGAGAAALEVDQLIALDRLPDWL